MQTHKNNKMFIKSLFFSQTQLIDTSLQHKPTKTITCFGAYLYSTGTLLGSKTMPKPDSSTNSV